MKRKVRLSAGTEFTQFNLVQPFVITVGGRYCLIYCAAVFASVDQLLIVNTQE